MTLKIFNSLSQAKEEFTPQNPSRVTMYVCGPTVYTRAHLGNARSAVVFDLVFRTLKYLYGENSVKYARNFTDVDDKIINQSLQSGESIQEITEKTIQWYHEDMGSLGVIKPTYEPRATEYIQDMQSFILNLLSKDSAYINDGHVLFNTASFKSYGVLNNRNLTKNLNQESEVTGKRNPADFVLWKPSSQENGWHSPWGCGRPGWHIECSTMAASTLGEQIDIHGGGIDLKFPHHENEIAQSEAAFSKNYVNYWMHNQFVTVNGEKMSKSRKNTITVHDLVTRTSNPLAIRLLLIGTHYRKPLDFTEQRLEFAEKELDKWSQKTNAVQESPVLDEVFLKHIMNDFNTPGAFAVMRQYYKENQIGNLKASMQFLGLL